MICDVLPSQGHSTHAAADVHQQLVSKAHLLLVTGTPLSDITNIFTASFAAAPSSKPTASGTSKLKHKYSSSSSKHYSQTAAAAATPQQQQRRKVKAHTSAPGCCSNCGTEQTSTWRKDRADLGRMLCNACGCYKNNHGVDRPLDGVFPCRSSSGTQTSRRHVSIPTRFSCWFIMLVCPCLSLQGISCVRSGCC